MINVSFLVLFFLCAQFLDGSESSAVSQQCWEQPAFGSQQEADIIKKASRINYTMREGNIYHTVNAFLDNHCEQIQQKIKEEVEERIGLLRLTNYAQCIPLLYPYKMIKRSDHDEAGAGEKKPAQTSATLWQRIKNIFSQKSDHVTKSTKPDPSEVQLYVYKNGSAITTTVDEKDVGNIDLNAGVAQRMQLYANLYNALSKWEGDECECSNHYATDICYLPALQAELLGNICMQLAVKLNKQETSDEKKVNVNDIAAFEAFVAQATQEELQNTKNWEYQPIANNIASYKKHIPLSDCCSQTRNLQGPFVLSINDPKYLDRDMTSSVTRSDKGGYKEYVPALPSRQLWTSNNQTEKIDNEDYPHRRIRFADHDWGYNFFLDFSQFSSVDKFKITTYNWTTNKEINKCVFAYAREYYEYLADQTKHIGIGDVKKCTQYGIGFVNLPSWDTREYGIELLPTHAYSNDKPALGVCKGLYRKRYDAQCDSKSLIETDCEIIAVAYDPGLEHILFATGTMLKLGCIDSTAGTMTFDLCSFKQPIKKVFVVDNRMYLIYTDDGHIYRYFYGDEDPVKLKFGSELPSIIDMAYDTTRQELAILTRDGVYTCVCHASTEDVEGRGEFLNAAHSFSNKAHRTDAGKIMPVAYDTSPWNLSLAKTCTLIPNDAFNIKKSYDAIDFQNGQIYVMCKTVGEFGLDNGRVLIYPPLTAAAADPDVSNDTVITIPIDQDQASSSSSSSISVKRQPTEAEGFHDDTDVIIDVGYCGEEEEDSL